MCMVQVGVGTNHIIKVYSRELVGRNFKLEVVDKELGTSQDATINELTYLNGLLTIDFDYVTSEASSYYMILTALDTIQNFNKGIVETTDLVGMSFDGDSTYMDLGLVPMMNTDDSYIKMNFKGTSWQDMNIPFGYVNTVVDKFHVTRFIGYEHYYLQAEVTSVSPSEYPTPDDYQEFSVIERTTPSNLNVVIGGANIPSMQNVPYTRRATSGLPFYLGARNNSGSASNFTEVIFTDIEFYNGVTTKLFNPANDWNGATNYGGIPMYSPDNGVTWSTTPSDMYDLPYAERFKSMMFATDQETKTPYQNVTENNDIS